jgi:hypothetical protein
MMVVNPRHYDRWSEAHLVEGCRRLTSGFLFWWSSEMRVSRESFSGPYQRMRTHCTDQRDLDETAPEVCLGVLGSGSSVVLVYDAAEDVAPADLAGCVVGRGEAVGSELPSPVRASLVVVADVGL